jgi:hypothetical protein
MIMMMMIMMMMRMMATGQNFDYTAGYEIIGVVAEGRIAQLPYDPV